MGSASTKWRQAAMARLGVWQGLTLAIETRMLLRRLAWPIYGPREAWALLRVLTSRRWGASPPAGPRVTRLERAFAQLHGATHGICTTSGATALAIAYRAAGLRRGDEIIVPALTFSATATAALEQGIVPVFVDVDPHTMCIDPAAVRRAITPRTKAVVAVHLGAQMADLRALQALCEDASLTLVEDCAHAHGAELHGPWTGRVRCYSFQSSKLLTCGEGGMILTDDEPLAARCRAYVDCGRTPRQAGLAHERLGSNHRMTELQAAVLLAQLSRFPQQMRRRRANLARLDAMLREIDGIGVLSLHDDVRRRPAYGYFLRYLGQARYGVPLRAFVDDLWSHGIVAWPSMYPPVYRSPEFGWREAPIEVDYSDVRCPVAEHAAAHELVWIPHMVFLAGPRQIRRIAETIRSLLASYEAGSR